MVIVNPIFRTFRIKAYCPPFWESEQTLLEVQWMAKTFIKSYITSNTNMQQHNIHYFNVLISRCSGFTSVLFRIGRQLCLQGLMHIWWIIIEIRQICVSHKHIKFSYPMHCVQNQSKGHLKQIPDNRSISLNRNTLRLVPPSIA